MKITDLIAGQMVKFNIWKTKRDVFRNSDPQVVEFRKHLFPDGEPTTDEFVIRLAQYVQEQSKKEENAP